MSIKKLFMEREIKVFDFIRELPFSEDLGTVCEVGTHMRIYIVD